MTFKELEREAKVYKPALVLDHFFPRKLRVSLRYFFLFVSFASFAASFVDWQSDSYNSLPDGLFFLFISLFAILFLLEAFYHSVKNEESRIDFVVAEIISKSDDMDITAGFLNTREAVNLLARLGISKVENGREPILGSAFEIVGTEEKADFADYAKAIYAADKPFASFVASRGVNEADYSGAVDWINDDLKKEKKEERWWSRDNLDSIPSLGTSLSYGRTYELSKYASSVPPNQVDIETPYRQKEVAAIENALLKGNSANAIIIDNDETVATDIVARLYKKIRLGLSPSALEHKTVLRLDWQMLSADKKTKPELEMELLKILSECEGTGNMILYIPNFPSFIAGAKALGVNLPILMEEYMVSPQIHIIAHATKTDFYYFIEMNPGLGRMFERIVPSEVGVEASMPVILEKAKRIEKNYDGRTKEKISFTYPALVEIAELADRLIAYGEMPTKALDMMTELVPWVAKEELRVILKNDVDVFASSKTGQTLGEISEDESKKLSKLEELLHQRIVGQDEAVSAVSGAMRRSRTGVNNPKRPIASFLFLGPTGVGKTETAKALTESFFGSEDKMTRFDMSEYNGADAIPRLIGNFSEGRAGNLASKLRDNPYGVLLLDEFEKAAPDVLNLFLRILDEGKFTDAFGGEVSVRNSIIIATSNAASELVWNIIHSSATLESKKDSIIDYLIANHIFKPELLNRFDAVVIFKPLENTELRAVAEMLLQKFIVRLKEEKQIELKPSSELLDYLVLHGADPEFGARSINRLMQSKIEDSIAKKIIAKIARPGSTIEMGVRDIM